MPERTEYVPGTPSWVDLATSDIDASIKFYCDLFGWETSEPSGPEYGGYRNFLLRGKPVAGIAPRQDEQQPVVWTSYISVEDVDATLEKVKEAGGTSLMDPMTIDPFGRMAIAIDPTGAAIAFWQANEHKGAGIVNEPGSLTWNELLTREPDKAKEFYAAIVGWEPKENDMGGMTYTTFELEDKPIAGMMGMGDEFPDEIPTHWSVYFAVADADATVEKIKSLGGSVLNGPQDIPEVGRFAAVADPQGAPFSVMANAQPTE